MVRSQVIPFGYSTPNAVARLEELMHLNRTILVDIRKSTKSLKKPEWSKERLQAKFGQRYLWIPELGNKNYFMPGAPIEIVDLAAGVTRLVNGLQQGYTLILLCTCAQYEKCHRKVVVDALLERMPEVEVIQPEIRDQSDTMKCLSIRQPYADWLVHPGRFMDNGIIPKTIENRDWSTSYRGPLLIHASSKFEFGAFEYWVTRCPALGDGSLWDVASSSKKDYVLGAIIGIADLVHVVAESSDPWFVGEYGFVLENARSFQKPIPYKGQLGLFNVSLLGIKTVGMPVEIL